jgi:uncharacterized protein (DUF302 family)
MNSSTPTPAPVRSYGFGATINAPYEQAVDRVRLAPKEEGFGVLTEIDVKQTLKAKLDVDFRPYVILGACNPQLAHRALSADLGIGLLLPCNVVVYDNGDASSTVEIMDPEAALGLGRQSCNRRDRARGAGAPAPCTRHPRRAMLT